MRLGDVVDGRFELERVGASGGMGEVFLAWDRATGSSVAVKVLLEGNAADRARFEREATLLSELNHPGIVRYITHGITSSGEAFLVMEWLEGHDLMVRLGRTGLTVDESVTVLQRASEALGAAHARGIVHRDLKPSNLFLERGDVRQVKLLDFGIARLGGGARMTKTGVLIGTPGYMAPEQARSERPADARADVFALGCVFFECLTGRPAFTGDHLMAVLAKILVEDPPPVRELRPEIPENLEALVARMLAKQPEARPRDGTAVAEALAAIGAPSALLGVVPPVSERAAWLTRSERRALSVVLLGSANPKADAAEAPTFGRTMTPSPADEALRREAAACGGSLEHMADGSTVVTLLAVGFATDQAARAARCALALRTYAASRPMALATGRGQVTGRMPLGDAIDRAVAMLSRRTQRGASSTEEGRPPIAIDEVTAGLLDARFDVRESDAGLELYRERDLADGARTLLGKPTACVGRDRELRMLEDIFVECVADSTAQAVVVIAPAGMGKSRLVHELLNNLKQREDAPSIWIGRGDPLRVGSAFALLGQALRGAFGIRDGEPIEVRREKLVARVAQNVPPAERRRVAEVLGDVIGTSFSDDAGSSLREARNDAQRIGEQMQMAWEDFLRAECSARPLLLVLEDMHWGDLPTLRFIDGARSRVRDKPWMMLGLARPEVHNTFPSLRDRQTVQEIRLKELSRKASERLVRQVLGDALDTKAVERLTAQADGNAFYLEELIRAAAERGTEALPETVVAMVQSRLGALDSAARRALRAASVFGEVLWPGGVASLLGSGERTAEVRAKLAELVDREVLVRRPESRFPGEEELAFRHALLREGAYAMLTEEDRALGHRLAAEWLARHGEGDPIVLAEHFEQGGRPVRAGGFYLRAAEQALYGNDAAAAIAQAGRGLLCGGASMLRVNLLGILCEAHVWRSEWSDAAPYAEEVMRLASPGSVPWAQGVTAKLIDSMYRGPRDRFITLVHSLSQVTLAPSAVVPITIAFNYGLFYLTVGGEFLEAESFLRKMHAVVDPIAYREPFAAGFLEIGDAFLNMYARQDVWSARERALAAKARILAAESRRGMSIAQIFTGMSLWLLGANAEAERELTSVLTTDREIGPFASVRQFSLVGVLIRRGALEEAHKAATELMELGRATRLPSQEGRGHWALADVLLRKGDLEAAEDEARAALEILAKLPLEHIAALATLAAIKLARGRAAEALAVADEALARYASIGACGWFRDQFLHLVRAESLYAGGDGEAGAAALSTATRTLLVNAAKIDDAEYRRRFLEDVPENARTLELARQRLDEHSTALGSGVGPEPSLPEPRKAQV